MEQPPQGWEIPDVRWPSLFQWLTFRSGNSLIALLPSRITSVTFHTSVSLESSLSFAALHSYNNIICRATI